MTWSAQRPDFENPDVGTPEFSADTFKKTETMTFGGKWMQLETIMSSKISQSQEDECVHFLICRT